MYSVYTYVIRRELEEEIIELQDNRIQRVMVSRFFYRKNTLCSYIILVKNLNKCFVHIYNVIILITLFYTVHSFN